MKGEARQVPAATFCLSLCFVGMKQFLSISLKVLLAAVIGVIIIHVWPLAIVPVIVGLVLGLALLALFLACLLAVGAVGGGVVIALLAVVLGILALLSPVLIPAALVLGIIWMVRKLSRSHPRPPVAA
jgi:hypothetical protein